MIAVCGLILPALPAPGPGGRLARVEACAPVAARPREERRAPAAAEGGGAETVRPEGLERLSDPRFMRLLPLACLAAAVCLFASELMTTFEFIPPGAEALADQGGADRHGNAIALLAAFAIGALAVAVFAASKPAAIAVAASGGVALLVFLLVDLPDAGAVGTLNDARSPTSTPRRSPSPASSSR